jgi:hypothetical protein
MRYGEKKPVIVMRKWEYNIAATQIKHNEKRLVLSSDISSSDFRNFNFFYIFIFYNSLCSAVGKNCFAVHVCAFKRKSVDRIKIMVFNATFNHISVIL